MHLCTFFAVNEKRNSVYSSKLHKTFYLMDMAQLFIFISSAPLTLHSFCLSPLIDFHSLSSSKGAGAAMDLLQSTPAILPSQMEGVLCWAFWYNVEDSIWQSRVYHSPSLLLRFFLCPTSPHSIMSAQKLCTTLWWCAFLLAKQHIYGTV